MHVTESMKNLETMISPKCHFAAKGYLLNMHSTALLSTAAMY